MVLTSPPWTLSLRDMFGYGNEETRLPLCTPWRPQNEDLPCG